MARRLSVDEIPSGWRYELLDNVATRCSGHTPSKSHDSYWNGGIKWVSLTDSHRLDSGYIFDSDKKISQEGIENSSAEVHPEETVVLSRDAGIGKSGVMAAPMAVSQHFIAWKCDNKNVLDSWFLYNWLQFNKREFERQAVGSTIKTIGLPYFKKLKIALPPFEEQQKITKILSTWDEAIATTGQLLANSEQQKIALMQKLLTGKKRLPGFDGEWAAVKLKDLLVEEKRRNQDGSVERVLSVSNKYGFILPEEHFSRKVASDNLSNYKIVKKGQFGYNPSRINVGSFARLDSYDIGVLSPMYVVFSVDEDQLNSDYFLSWMESNEASQRILSSTQGSVRDSVGFDALCSFPFKLPSIKEQDAIAKIISSSNSEITGYRAYLEFLKGERRALMQQLLTGKRRVKVDKSKWTTA